MGEATRQPKSTGRGRTAWLLGFLVLFAIGWGILIFRVPILWQGAFSTFRLDRVSGVARLALSNDDADDPWSQEIAFDVHSGSLDWKMSREIDGTFFHAGTDLGNSKYGVLLLNQNLTSDNCRLVSLHDSKIPDREFLFPTYPYQVNGRFAVAESLNKAEQGIIAVMDFADESSTIKRTEVAGIPVVGGIKPINEVDGFLRFQPLPVLGNPPSNQVQHFTIGSDLAATPGVTWQALILGTIPAQCIMSSGDELVSINPTNFEIEFRKASNGKLIETMPLLKGMDPVTMPCDFWTNFLRIEPTVGSPRFFDLKRRKWLPVIGGSNFGPHSVLDDKYVLFRGHSGNWRMSSKIFDVDREVVISEFDSHTRTDFIDETSILDVSFFSGLTIQKIDLQTGKVLQTWKPFWWVIPLTSFLCVGWLIWSWAWLSTSGKSRPASVWSDVAIVTMLPLVLCILRLKYIGNITDLSRIPISVAQGIILALLASGVVWLVHSRTRIVPRILPFLIAMTVLAASVTITFDGKLAYVVPGAIQALIPVSVFLVCFLGFRRLGYRLFAPGELEVAVPIDKANLVTIRDMFVLTAVLAMLFAGLSPWLPSLGDIYQSMLQVLSALGQFAILSLGPVVAWWLAMSQKKIRSLGDVLFLGTFAFLVASAAYRFAGSSSLIFDLSGFIPSIDALPAMCFVTTYWVACCFRFRGWRFCRSTIAAT